MIKNKILENMLTKLIEKTGREDFLNQPVELRNVMSSLWAILEENRKIPKEHVLTAEEGGRLKQLYESFKTASLEYMGKFNDEISDMLFTGIVPLTSYINLFEKIAAGDVAGLVLDQVLQNDNLLDGFFTKDKGPADREGYQPGKYRKEYANPMEALREYNTLTSGMRNRMDQHISTVTGCGNNERIEQIFKAKLALLKEIIRDNAPLMNDGRENPRLNGFNLQNIYEDYIAMADSIDAKKANARNLYVKGTLNTTIDNVFNFSSYHNDINHIIPEKTPANEKILHELFKLRLNPKVVGFTEENLEQLQNCTDALSVPMGHLENIQMSMDLDEENVKIFLNNPDSIYYRFLKSIDNIKTKIEAILHGRAGAAELKTADYLEYIAAIEEYMDKHGILDEKGGYDSLINYGKLGVEQMMAVLPGVKKAGGKFLDKLNQLIKREAVNDVNMIGTLNMNDPEEAKTAKALYDRLHGMYSVRYINSDGIDHVRLLMMIKDPNYLKREMDFAKNDLENLIRKRNSEEDKVNRAGSPVSKAECRKSASRILLLGNLLQKMRASKDDSPSLLNAAWDNGAMTKEQVAGIFDYFNKFEQMQGVKDLLSGDYLTEEELISTDKLDYLANNLVMCKFKPFAALGISDEIVQSLTEKSGKWGTSHSPEYQKIRTAMTKLQKQESPLMPDYRAAYSLYKACSDYLRIHSTDHRHFNDAAQVMAKLTIPLMKAMPEKLELIEQDLQINMLRSKFYRNQVMQNAGAVLAEMGSAIPEDSTTETRLNKLPVEEKNAMDGSAFILSYGKLCYENESKIPANTLKGNLKTEAKLKAFLQKTNAMYRKAAAVKQEYRNNLIRSAKKKVENDKKLQVKKHEPVKNM